ncbi:hypothetical protein VC82_2994 [Flagellimonas lutaonensis]|uniref:Uncharacterized protein n=1 Tax=Flagellimonas lutaonensis TaxID=516051 RepID=A0A0D5YXH3_9FLAO|nr:hypothetical protein VC82_2994 [Allomuricauda lutaonensis]
MIKVLVFVCLANNSITGQNLRENRLTDIQQEVLNQVFAPQHNKVFIYNTTDFDKGWSIYFEKDDLSLITQKVGFPTKITDGELLEILKPNVIKQIWHEILHLKPYSLEKNRFNPKIILTKSYDKPVDLKRGVIKISAPIIIGDIAVYREIGAQKSPIFILQKAKQQWEVIYTFYHWNIIE